MKINWKSKILVFVTSLAAVFSFSFCAFSMDLSKWRSDPDYKHLNMLFYMIGDIRESDMCCFFGRDFGDSLWEWFSVAGGVKTAVRGVKILADFTESFVFSDVEGKICKLVREHPKLVNVFLVDGLRLLHRAVKFRSKALFDCLIDLNADVNCTDVDGNTPLILALCNDFSDMAKLLIDKRADVDCRDEKGNPALILALRHDDFVTSEALLKKGASPDCKDETGCPCLVLAVVSNNDAFVALLLRYHANPDCFGCDGRTPLLIALEEENLSIFRALLKSGADVNLRHSKKHYTPLVDALYGREYDEDSVFVKELRERGAKEEICCSCFIM